MTDDLKKSFGSWFIILSIFFSSISAFRLITILFDLGISEFLKPLIDYYNYYISKPFYLVINYAFNYFNIDVSILFSDFTLLYIVLMTVLLKPLIKSYLASEFTFLASICMILLAPFLTIKQFYRYRLSRRKKIIRYLALLPISFISVLYAIVIPLLLVVIIILYIVFNYLIGFYYVIDGLIKPYIFETRLSTSNMFSLNFNQRDKNEENDGSHYIGNYRVDLLISVSTFIAALSLIVITNLFLEYYDV